MKCESDDDNFGYCTTQACKRESKNILDKLDTSVDACDDFYKHVCGKFIENTKIPDDKTSVDVSTDLDDKLKAQLNEILNSSISKDDIGPFKLSKKLYKACMNKGRKKNCSDKKKQHKVNKSSFFASELIEELNLKPLKKQLEAVGGLCVKKNQDKKTNQFVIYCYKHEKYSITLYCV